MYKQLFTVLFMCCIGLSAYAEIKHIDNAELKTLMENGVPVIDIRTPPEWKQTGIVENSHLLMFFDQMGRYDANAWLAEFSKIVPNKDDPFILICRSGNRTLQISQFLDTKLGYSQVHNVKRGIRQWIREKNPTVQAIPQD